jgi:hypothetical protein
MQKKLLVGIAMMFAVALAADAAAQPWVARHGMTSAQYQAEFNAWTAAGYRLTHVSAADVAGTPRFAAIFEQKAGPAWVARHGMTSAQYQTEFNARVSQGYRLVLIDGYEVAGAAR